MTHFDTKKIITCDNLSVLTHIFCEKHTCYIDLVIFQFHGKNILFKPYVLKHKKNTLLYARGLSDQLNVVV